MKEADKILFNLNSRELIDSYVDKIVGIKECNAEKIKDIDSFRRTMVLLKPHKMEIEKGILRTKKRHDLFTELKFSSKLKKRINHYLSETKETCPSLGIVKETVSDICRSLFEIYVANQKTNLPTEIIMVVGEPFKNVQKLYDVIGSLKGDIRVIDKDFDTKGFMFFEKLNPSKATKLRILGEKLKQDYLLRKNTKLLEMNWRKEALRVEFRMLSEEDAGEVFHDRYVITDEIVYSTPPWNIIHRKYGDVRSLDNVFEKKRIFELYWSRATNLVRNK